MARPGAVDLLLGVSGIHTYTLRLCWENRNSPHPPDTSACKRSAHFISGPGGMFYLLPNPPGQLSKQGLFVWPQHSTAPHMRERKVAHSSSQQPACKPVCKQLFWQLPLRLMNRLVLWIVYLSQVCFSHLRAVRDCNVSCAHSLL